MKALLCEAISEVAPACPYAFLLQEDGPTSLAPHWEWLKAQKLVVPADIGAAPLPSLRSDVLPEGWAWSVWFAPALALVAQPRARLRIIRSGKDGVAGASHILDHRAVMVAQLDQDHCVLSDLLPLPDLMDRLVKEIGVPGSSAPTPLRTDHKVIRVLGALAAAGLAVSGQKKSEIASTPPLIAPQIVDILASVVEDKSLATTLMEDLVTDQLLVFEHGNALFHAKFSPWHQALTSGEQLEIHRLELPNGNLPVRSQEQTTRLFFLGPSGQRCLVWPVGDGSHEVILSRPALQDLRTFLGTVVGWSDTESGTVSTSSNLPETPLLAGEQRITKPRSRS